MTNMNKPNDVISMSVGFSGADLTISWFFGKTDM